MYVFPSELLKSETFQPWLANTRVGGGNTLNGLGQSADWSGGGYWAAEMTNIYVDTVEEHLAFNALCTLLSDGGVDVEVTVVDGYTWPIGNATPETMSFKANAAANLSATSIDIKVLVGGELKPGHKFTIDHPLAKARMYSVKAGGVTYLGGNVYRCKFKPPLREAVAINTVVDCARPRITMTVTSSAKDMWPRVSRPYKARPQLKFIESFSYQNVL